MAIPIATLVFTAMELSNMYLEYAKRAQSMTVEEANALWAELSASVKDAGENFDAAVAEWHTRHTEG